MEMQLSTVALGLAGLMLAAYITRRRRRLGRSPKA
jgi:LPXTG-motif cell wall-anchored protein